MISEASAFVEAMMALSCKVCSSMVVAASYGWGIRDIGHHVSSWVSPSSLQDKKLLVVELPNKITRCLSGSLCFKLRQVFFISVRQGLIVIHIGTIS